MQISRRETKQSVSRTALSPLREVSAGRISGLIADRVSRPSSPYQSPAICNSAGFIMII
jgi:hypothetical protein